MSGCDNCGVAVDREPSVLCNECSEHGPRITPAMVRRLKKAIAAHCYDQGGRVDAWAARENKRATVEQRAMAAEARAAREERERVVAYAIECAGRCNTLSERHLFLAFADALNDGDHAKGGR